MRKDEAYAPEQDIGSAASHSQEVPALRPPGRRSSAGPLPGPDRRTGDRRREQRWSVGDLLSRAWSPKPHPMRRTSHSRNAPQVQKGAQGLRIDEIARAIDPRARRPKSGSASALEMHGVLGRHLYSADGQSTFDEISRRYDRDGEFRLTVDRYMGDFERLLGEAEQADPDGRMMQTYLTSETGPRLSCARACEWAAAVVTEL